MPHYPVFKVHPHTIIVSYATKYRKFLVRYAVNVHYEKEYLLLFPSLPAWKYA